MFSYFLSFVDFRFTEFMLFLLRSPIPYISIVSFSSTLNILNTLSSCDKLELIGNVLKLSSDFIQKYCAIEINTAEQPQQTHQRWIDVENNVDRQRLSTLFQRWCLVKNESWVNVHLSSLFQRWQNNIEAMSMELPWFNVDELMLFQRWDLVEIECWADVYLSTLFHRWQNNVGTALKELSQFNVDDPALS